MRVLDDADRCWVFAFPRHPDIGVVMTYEEYAPHTGIIEIERHPRDTYGYVLSGQLTIKIPNLGVFKADRGDAFFLKANTDHTAQNTGSSVLKMTVVHSR